MCRFVTKKLDVATDIKLPGGGESDSTDAILPDDSRLLDWSCTAHIRRGKPSEFWGPIFKKNLRKNPKFSVSFS